FEEAAVLPLGDLYDWPARGRVFAAVASLMSQTRLDPSRTLLLHDEPASRPATRGLPGPAREVRIEEYSPDRVRLTVDAPRPGYVQLSDNAFPGWRARLDGKPVKILRSWFTFRTVEVPTGRSTLEFAYRPGPLSAALGGGAALACLWAMLYWRYRGRRAGLLDAGDVVLSKKGKPQPLSPEAALLVSCAGACEWFVLVLSGSAMAFWFVWSLLVYAGDDRVISCAGAAAGAAFALGALAVFGAGRASRPSPIL
ncbi:MAG: hypothetical protein HYZ74_05355, partial [Elusimicrobia bacterium]|nr:hypothetical protein [Elusimicrobiota bacterium]